MNQPPHWVNPANTTTRTTRAGASHTRPRSPTQPAHAQPTHHAKPAEPQDDCTIRLRVHARLLTKVQEHLTAISDEPADATFNRLLRSALRRWLRDPTAPTYHIDPAVTELAEVAVVLPKGLIQRWLAQVYSSTPTREVRSDLLIDSLHHAICLRVGLDPTLRSKRSSGALPRLRRPSPAKTPVPAPPDSLADHEDFEAPTHATLEDALTQIFTQPTATQGSDAPKPPPPPSTRPVAANDAIPRVLSRSPHKP